ncbi:MAG: hypothetical protein PHX83_09100 [Acidobacteriia bacterium]|nr:hypothetical protein [Terriglobia bacterium]
MALMPEYAPFVALAFLGTGFLTVVGLLAAAITWWTTWRFFSKWILAAVALLLVGYACVLLAASATSRQIVLGLGQNKYFCEIDCHLAYSVSGVETVKSIGDGNNVVTARGIFYIVTVKTWFDPATISPHRGYGPLSPNPRELRLVDLSGGEYPVSESGMAALEKKAGPQTPITEPLRPGESYLTRFVFDVPAGAKNPRLLLSDMRSDTLTGLLIGHELSPFHQKIYFSLTASASSVGGFL